MNKRRFVALALIAVLSGTAACGTVEERVDQEEYGPSREKKRNKEMQALKKEIWKEKGWGCATRNESDDAQIARSADALGYALPDRALDLQTWPVSPEIFARVTVVSETNVAGGGGGC